MTGLLHKRLNTEITPFIDGNTGTFVWNGRTAPSLIGDFTGGDEGDAIELTRTEPGIWTCQLEFPQDAYIEYSFVKNGKNILDPHNPRYITNGVGGYNNYFGMPGHQPTSLAQKNTHARHGVVKEYHLPTEWFLSGNQRKVYLYQPPVAQRVPLVVVWDGREYLRRGRLNHIVDNLIDQGRIQPIALAFVTNAGQKSRALEYSCNEATLAFLMTQVIPFATKELNLVDINKHPGEFGVLGASMGGLYALYTGARLPQVFGKVLSQSGAFSISGYDMVVFDLLQCGERKPLEIWMDVGLYDLVGLLEANRHMHEMLLQRGYSPGYREYSAGHNYPSWRNDIWRGLEAHFGTGQKGGV